LIKNRPSFYNKNSEFYQIGKWTSRQMHNYSKKINGMKNINTRKAWEEFINDSNYKKYF
jgi:hypothetical protein